MAAGLSRARTTFPYCSLTPADHGQPRPREERGERLSKSVPRSKPRQNGTSDCTTKGLAMPYSKPDVTPEWIRVSEAAARLNCHPKTVLNRIRAGTIPARVLRI